MKEIAMALVRIYRYCISPLSAPSCRYYPSCSQYALESIERFGFLKGCYFAVRRVLRCHPGCPGGYDPVPDDPKAKDCCDHRTQEPDSSVSNQTNFYS